LSRVVIELTEDEQARMIEWCKKVQADKQARNSIDKRVDKRFSSFDIMLLGLCGEYAICKHLGIPYNFRRWDEQGKGDVTHNGYEIEVKTNKYRDDLLKIPEWQVDCPADIYVLAQQLYRLKLFEILGYATRETFRALRYKKTFPGYEDKPMFVMDYLDLERPEYFRSALLLQRGAQC